MLRKLNVSNIELHAERMKHCHILYTDCAYLTWFHRHFTVLRHQAYDLVCRLSAVNAGVREMSSHSVYECELNAYCFKHVELKRRQTTAE